MAYTEKYECDPDDDVFTVEDFKGCCESGALIDYDGYGSPIKDKKVDKEIIILPSTLDRIPKDATHIVWFYR